LNSVPSYRECAWAAESYLTIQNETGLTFETIFLVLPIEKMFEYFSLYHEMDFSQIVDEFNEIYKKESILSIVMNRLGYSIKYISESTGLPYDSLSSYKQRRRDIKKMSADSACLLATLLRIRIETLIELRM
jgi:hypothetical protein